MIVVKIELWPGGDPGRCREIGRMTLTNLGTGTEYRGNYIARVMRRGTEETVQREAAIEGHARKAAPIWHLVQKALDGAFGRRRS